MRKTIELSRVRQDEHFTLDGIEWAKLDETHMGAFVVSPDTLPDNCPFESDDDRKNANNFCGSHIAKEIERWLQGQRKPILGATLERSIDLTATDDMTNYGTPLAIARPLTIDDYRKYRRFIPLASRPSWLATGQTTKSSPSSSGGGAYVVRTDGTVNDGYVYHAYFTPRLALYLESSIPVPIKAEEEQKSIRDYINTELTDELYRRGRAGYDPD